ncbi:MAG: hypothetical protein HGA85_04395 [Nanoarchaeota archaeon]|nr:hypothetical protein [Nanoarchaeota archaeon]
MKTTTIILLATLVLLASCASKIPTDQAPPGEYATCSSDSDCIPQPGCHPVNCINSRFADRFKAPDACTMEYRCNAAYSAEDCMCQAGKCINRKTIEGDPSCEPTK